MTEQEKDLVLIAEQGQQQVTRRERVRGRKISIEDVRPQYIEEQENSENEAEVKVDSEPVVILSESQEGKTPWGKIVGWSIFGVLAAGALAIGGYVQFHKPDVVEHVCIRSTHCANGKPKIAFDTPQQANWQTVKIFFKYFDIQNSYQVGDKYYTGHSSK